MEIFSLVLRQHPFTTVSDQHAMIDVTILTNDCCQKQGLACFEGMKAYKTLTDGSLRLFRPDRNAERLARSMERLEMPGYDFDQAELIDCIAELVRLDKDWIPEGEGYSLYLRPTVIATHNFLGLAPPTKVLLYVITSPIGPYYKTGFEPIRLMAESSFIRAWPGGTGNAKVCVKRRKQLQIMRCPNEALVRWAETMHQP